MAEKEKVKRNNIINLHLLNVVSNLFAEKHNRNFISYEDIFGELQLKDYDLKTRRDFETREEFLKYVEEVIKPLKKELGVNDGD